MKDHMICQNSGAMVFYPTEGDLALDQIKSLADAMLIMAEAINAGTPVPEPVLAQLRAIRRSR